MDVVAKVAGFCLGAAISFVWLTGVILPMVYAIPRALYWAKRGLFSWRLAFHFVQEATLVAAVTTAIFFGFLFMTQRWTLSQVAVAYNWGSLLGLIGACYPLSTTDGRRALKNEFVRTAIRYVVSDNPSTFLLLTEFKKRNGMT